MWETIARFGRGLWVRHAAGLAGRDVTDIGSRGGRGFGKRERDLEPVLGGGRVICWGQVVL